MPISSGHDRRRREGDEGAAVSVARGSEFAGRIGAQQLDAGGVQAIADGERAAESTGRLREAHLGLAFLGRPEADVHEVDLIGLAIIAESGNESVETRRRIDQQRAADAAVGAEVQPVDNAAALDLERAAVQCRARDEATRLHDFVPGAENQVADRRGTAGHDFDSTAANEAGACGPAALDQDLAAAADAGADRKPAARYDLEAAAV